MAQLRCLSHSLLLLFICVAAGCGTPPPVTTSVDAELDRSNSAARAAYERGALSEAATLYEQALSRSRAMDDPQEVADAAYNLAACLMGFNDLDRARLLLHEAEWELAKITKNADDVLLLEAKIARQQGKNAEALSLTDRLISQPRRKGEPGPPVGVDLLRGRLALDRHDVGAAIREWGAASAANAAHKGKRDDLATAGIFGLTAEIGIEQKMPGPAATAFEMQALMLEAAADYSGMGMALGHAGTAYLAAGARAPAADRLYRAARCLFSLGNTVQATKFLNTASKAAEAAKSSSISGLIHGLQEEMSIAATRPSATTLPSIPTEATTPQ